MGTVEDEIHAVLITRLPAGVQSYDHAKAIAAALREAGMVREWEPIETAPKDGTDVLVFDPIGKEQFVAFYDDGLWVFAKKKGGPRFAVKLPTRWMPLPPLPEGTEK
jgi:hypothetical protein